MARHRDALVSAGCCAAALDFPLFDNPPVAELSLYVLMLALLIVLF